MKADKKIHELINHPCMWCGSIECAICSVELRKLIIEKIKAIDEEINQTHSAVHGLLEKAKDSIVTYHPANVGDILEFHEFMTLYKNEELKIRKKQLMEELKITEEELV